MKKLGSDSAGESAGKLRTCMLVHACKRPFYTLREGCELFFCSSVVLQVDSRLLA